MLWKISYLNFHPKMQKNHTMLFLVHTSFVLFFQVYSLLSWILLLMLLSPQMQHVEKEDLKCIANWWSMSLGSPWGTPNVESAIKTAAVHSVCILICICLALARICNWETLRWSCIKVKGFVVPQIPRTFLPLGASLYPFSTIWQTSLEFYMYQV